MKSSEPASRSHETPTRQTLLRPNGRPLLVGLLLGSLVACGGTSPPPKVATFEREEPEPEPTVDPELAPGLPSDQIEPVVLEKYGAIGGCHALEYAGQEQAGGNMTLDWMIQPDGSVTDVVILESTFDNDGVERCVIEVASTLVFPEAPGNTPVSWRFKFRPSSDGKTARVD